MFDTCVTQHFDLGYDDLEGVMNTQRKILLLRRWKFEFLVAFHLSINLMSDVLTVEVKSSGFG